jgi:signal transduction histidine kinase
MDSDANRSAGPGHFGLRNMRERAEAIGGSLDIGSGAGSGTTIDLRVPAHVAHAMLH